MVLGVPIFKHFRISIEQVNKLTCTNISSVDNAFCMGYLMLKILVSGDCGTNQG